MDQFEAGWYPDIKNNDYHASAGTSSSTLKKFVDKSPAFIKWQLSQPQEKKAAFTLGSLTHTLVLEPHQFENEYYLVPDLNMRLKASKELVERLSLENPDKTAVSESVLEQAKAMTDSIFNHENAAILLSDFLPEQSIYWHHKGYDQEDFEPIRELVKVRPDAISLGHNMLLDIKTCQDASYTGFIKDVIKYKYHLSAAMYLDGVNQCEPLLEHLNTEKITHFCFVCVESNPPYQTALYILGEEAIEDGRKLYQDALIALHRAKNHNWPGYTQDIRIIELPSYSRNKWII